MKKLIIILSLLCNICHAAITFHAVGSGVNQNGGTITVTLPTISTNDYALCYFAISGGTTVVTNAPFTTPAGWTSLINVNAMALFGQVWTSGTTIATTPQNGAANWESGICLSYTGVNTTTPTGTVNTFFINNSSSASNPNDCTAPPVFPNWTTGMDLAFFADFNAGSASISTATGYTSRANYTPGSSIAIQELATSSASPTAPANSIFGAHVAHACAQIFLLPASGGSSATQTVQPTIAGLDYTSLTIGLPILNNDLVAYYGFGAGAACTVTTTGYTKVYTANDMAVWTHKWLTGDTTTLTTSGCSSGSISYVLLIRNATGGTAPSVDSLSPNGATATASATTTINCPSITISGSNELLICQYSSGNSTTGNNGSWTIPGGLTYLWNNNFASSFTSGFGILQNPPQPTGTFTGTNSASGVQNAGAVAFCISCGGSATQLWMGPLN